MRAPIFLSVVLMIGLTGACSNPPDSANVQTDDSFSSELELAIFAAGGGADAETQVVSDLEIRRPGPPAPTSISVVEEPRPAAPAPDPEPVVSLALLGEPVHTAPSLPTIESVNPATASGGSDDYGRAGPEVGRSGGARGGIIIRGGVGARDPCAIHFPGVLTGGGGDLLGAIGVLINNPAPRDIGPTTQRGSSRRGGMIPRGGGGMLAGGIRYQAASNPWDISIRA